MAIMATNKNAANVMMFPRRDLLRHRPFGFFDGTSELIEPPGSPNGLPAVEDWLLHKRGQRDRAVELPNQLNRRKDVVARFARCSGIVEDTAASDDTCWL